MKTLLNTKPLVAAVALAISTSSMAETMNPHDKDDDAQVTMSGTMTKIDGDEFVLNYRDGSITIELEDWERDAEDLNFKNGAEVTVFGEIDNDLFTDSTIEAEAIYIKSTGSYYYASDSEDAESYRNFLWSDSENYELSDMTLRGRVVSTDVDNGEFTIAVGEGEKVTVSIAALDHDVLKGEKRDPVDAGDWVRVAGRLDYEFFDGKLLRAKSVTTIFEDEDPA